MADPAGATEPAALELRDVRRSFSQAGGTLEILRGVDLAIVPGEMVALVGPSGAGKSTLLHIAGLLEPPTSGHVIYGGWVCAKLSQAERTPLRPRRVGLVC